MTRSAEQQLTEDTWLDAVTTGYERYLALQADISACIQRRDETALASLQDASASLLRSLPKLSARGLNKKQALFRQKLSPDAVDRLTALVRQSQGALASNEEALKGWAQALRPRSFAASSNHSRWVHCRHVATGSHQTEETSTERQSENVGNETMPASLSRLLYGAKGVSSADSDTDIGGHVDQCL